MTDLGSPLSGPLGPGPFLPRVREAYWVDATILPFADAGGQQAVVVVDVPATTTGTIGVEVPGAGRVPVQAILWTPANVLRIE
jgi:hypothetical protein